jgi:NDP-sugar pyrophosphorylase family protein
MSSGSWVVANTDMVIPGLDLTEMLMRHMETGAAWTALTGGFPPDGRYAPLRVDSLGRFGRGGDLGTHYWGISIMESSVFRLAEEVQASGGLFGQLAPLARERCGELLTFHQEGYWLDMGRTEGLRERILRGGSFVHPSACVSSDAVLEGSWNIGRGCMLGSGTVLSDSVMLEGSTLEGGRLHASILPWFCSSGDGSSI